MELKRRLFKYFEQRLCKTLKLSNGDEVKLIHVIYVPSRLELTFSHCGDEEEIVFDLYGDLITASSDSMELQVSVTSMQHAGFIVNRALCHWIENKDDIDLEWKD